MSWLLVSLWDEGEVGGRIVGASEDGNPGWTCL